MKIGDYIRQSELSNAPGHTSAAPLKKTRRRLFIKYVALFVAVVCVALLSNGVFDVFFYYQEHKTPPRFLNPHNLPRLA